MWIKFKLEDFAEWIVADTVRYFAVMAILGLMAGCGINLATM